MAAQSPEFQPPPDPRALLTVLEAQRRSESGSRADLTTAALSIARDQDVGELQVRRAADAYTDAVEGFIRPTATWGYVFAAFYAMRRRVATWIGIPFVLLLVLAGGAWGTAAFEKAHKLDLLRVEVRARLNAAHQKYEDAATVYAELDRMARSERRLPSNFTEIQNLLIHLRKADEGFRRRFERAEELPGRDERALRRIRAETQDFLDELENFETNLNRGRELLLKGRETLRVRSRLDAVLAEAQSLKSPLFGQAEAIYAKGASALQRDDPEAANEWLAELSRWVKAEREAAQIPDQLNELLAKVKDLTTDAEALSRAAALHRQGRWAVDRSERPQARESIHLLKQLADDLSAEYTVVITGGKWRFKNSDPSVRNYYVIVEAVDPRGVRLEKHIRNEEDGTTATVKQWGERVPFELYERVRRDKQDNGRIDQDLFGRKARGRLEIEVELRTDQGEVLPRTGQITRW